jgi:hypothetical protein
MDIDNIKEEYLNKENSIINRLLFPQNNTSDNLIGGNNELSDDDQQIIYDYIINDDIFNSYNKKLDFISNIYEIFKNKSYVPNIFRLNKDLTDDSFKYYNSHLNLLYSNEEYIYIYLIDKSIKLNNLFNIELNKSDILYISNLGLFYVCKFTKTININTIDDFNKFNYINKKNYSEFSIFYLLNNINNNKDIYYDIISQIEYNNTYTILNNPDICDIFIVHLYNNIYLYYDSSNINIDIYYTNDFIDKTNDIDYINEKYILFITNNLNDLNYFLYYIIYIVKNQYNNINDITYSKLINLIYNKLLINNIIIGDKLPDFIKDEEEDEDEDEDEVE